MTTSKPALGDQIAAAMGKATELYYAMLAAEKELNDTATTTAKKIESAQATFTKARDAQNVLSQAAAEKYKEATEILLAYQGQASNDLGITINVLPQPPGGSTNL